MDIDKIYENAIRDESATAVADLLLGKDTNAGLLPEGIDARVIATVAARLAIATLETNGQIPFVHKSTYLTTLPQVAERLSKTKDANITDGSEARK